MFEILSVCKGGGYQYCRTEPSHPKANSKGLYPLHRVLAENKLGRLLVDGEDVHHGDENKTNNDPDNLIVLTKSDHARLHHPEQMVEAICSTCGQTFEIKPAALRLRQKRNLSCRIFCSRSCQRPTIH